MRKKHMRQIDRENKQVLRGYAKTADVMRKFAKEFIDNNMESGDDEDELASQLENEQVQAGSRDMIANPTSGSQLTSIQQGAQPSQRLEIERKRQKMYSSIDGPIASRMSRLGGVSQLSGPSSR